MALRDPLSSVSRRTLVPLKDSDETITTTITRKYTILGTIRKVYEKV